ncbi:MAG: hypothetical protein F6K22_36680 [Okeania sp. SIO2F4]|uniref:hypothetical protein n=1 Tax=Okeania sp. SIO2F4 TaxID=2607790 RepID=UPI00142B9B44|nr:hypothetical protein [Okeania sp. SIO2F4]NES07842.1 hypothetical protein [Okeania sp. SIO2F4]
MSVGIVCVKARVNIYRKFKFFPAFQPFFLLTSYLPYNTDATGHDMTEKYVLREAAKPLITETIYHRQKHPSYRWCVIWYFA